jgi:23S rRNA pseudouridine2605 synthase
VKAQRARSPAKRDRSGETEKLHKVLAEAGVGSRREMERWIAAGRVSVNDAVACLGMRVAIADRIAVDGVALPRGGAVTPRIIVMNKAEGVICTRRDPDGRPTCFDSLPRLQGARWASVGRLDINSSGLLLFSNDGDLVHRLMHPSAGLDREYAVRIDGVIDAAAEAALRDGVLLDDVVARFSDIAHHGGRGRNHWYHVTLLEGRNREVRRLLESQGLKVSRLKRVRYGPVILPSWLRRGEWVEMSAADVMRLYRVVGLEAPRLVARRDERRVRSVLIAYPEIVR